MAWRRGERPDELTPAGASAEKRELLVSRTWLQVAGLVCLAGFFVLVLLAYRTYQSDPPIPARAVDPSGKTVYTREDVLDGQKVFLHHGLMEYGSIFGHGAYLGPDFTADYLHRASASVRNQLGGTRSDSARQETIEQFQANRYDSASGDPSPLGPAIEGVPPAGAALRRLLRQPDDQIRAASEAGRRPAADPSADGLLRLVELGGGDPAPGPQLLVHQQLAARGAGREHAERRRRRLVGDLADRAARRHRDPLRGLRPLEARLAGARAGDAQLPLPGGRGADTGPAGDGLVLLRDGGAVPACRLWSAPPRSTTGPSSTASSASTSPRSSPTTWSAPGTCSWRSSSSPPRSSPPASSLRR